MKKAQVEIVCRDNRYVGTVPVHVQVPGYLVGPGLAVTKIAYVYDGKIDHLCDDWNVTHIPSGYCAAGSFELRRQAAACAERLLALADWTQDMRDVGRELKGQRFDYWARRKLESECSKL